jgi:hypothetical protein
MRSGMTKEILKPKGHVAVYNGGAKHGRKNFRFRVPTLSTHLMDASTLCIKVLKQTRSFA